MSGVPWFIKSKYDYFQYVSAMQKYIRRGDEDNALFWATELFLHGASAQVWSRLVIIASEDVGEADPLMHLKITMLRYSWCETPKEQRIDGKGRLFFVQAVLMLVHSPKSRRVDNAGIVYCEGERPHREIPDFAKDKHTNEGKALGRSWDHFFDEGARLENESGNDPYHDQAKNIRMKSKNEQETTQ
jgi:replication-associated recombination protein RarA